MPKRCLTSFLALRGFLPASGFWLGALSQIPPCAYRYTLLVGKPPFETSCLKETYLRIKNNEYSIPKVTKTTLSLHLFYLIPSPTKWFTEPSHFRGKEMSQCHPMSKRKSFRGSCLKLHTEADVCVQKQFFLGWEFAGSHQLGSNPKDVKNREKEPE